MDYNVYAADVFQGVLYQGGWLTKADIGPDRLYQSNATVDRPVEITWTKAAPYNLYHLNDPSVVRKADGTLAMFMTALPNAYGDSKVMFDRNVTGLATSTNQGQSWTWQGIVIGQNNGLDATGAWSPSAIVNANGIAVWYHTGAHDVSTGAYQPTRVLLTELDATGTHILSTVPTIDTVTGMPVSAANVDVRQADNGIYWMVANDYSVTNGDGGKIALYHSADKISWTPWSPSGATLLSPRGGSPLLTPTITSISGDTINLIYGEQLAGSATVEQALTITLSDQPATPKFSKTAFFDGIQTSTVDVAGEAYMGPVSYLKSQFIQQDNDTIDLKALVPNAYLHCGSGKDALTALSGHNVLDGTAGTAFMTGEIGIDTFFTAVNPGIDTWSTIKGFKIGDDIAIWDLTPSMVTTAWNASQGLPIALGATLHISTGQGHWASLTLASWSVQDTSVLESFFRHHWWQKLSTSGGLIDPPLYLLWTITLMKGENE